MIMFYLLEFIFGVVISGEIFIDQYLRTMTSFYRIPMGIMIYLSVFVAIIISGTLRSNFGLSKIQHVFGYLILMLPIIVLALLCKKWFSL